MDAHVLASTVASGKGFISSDRAANACWALWFSRAVCGLIGDGLAPRGCGCVGGGGGGGGGCCSCCRCWHCVSGCSACRVQLQVRARSGPV